MEEKLKKNLEEIIVRNASPDDLDEIMKIEEKEYGPIDWVVPKEVMKYRLKNCYFKEPGDLFWVAVKDQQIVGYITGMIINFDPKNPPNTRREAIGYKRASDGKEYGFGTKHNPNGNALYVMSIGVLEKGKGIASKLIQTTVDFVKNNGYNGLQYRVAGLRSGYAEFVKRNPDITPEQYIQLRREDGQYVDGFMRLYSRFGFKELCMKKDYAPEDKVGEGWGNIMVWENKDYIGKFVCLEGPVRYLREMGISARYPTKKEMKGFSEE